MKSGRLLQIKVYEDLFVNQQGGSVADDHLIVNRQTDIRMINIIHHSVNENGGSVSALLAHSG